MFLHLLISACVNSVFCYYDKIPSPAYFINDGFASVNLFKGTAYHGGEVKAADQEAAGHTASIDRKKGELGPPSQLASLFFRSLGPKLKE